MTAGYTQGIFCFLYTIDHCSNDINRHKRLKIELDLRQMKEAFVQKWVTHFLDVI